MYRLVEVDEKETIIVFRFIDLDAEENAFSGVYFIDLDNRFSVYVLRDSVWAYANKVPLYPLLSWELIGGISPMEFSYGMPMEIVIRGLSEVIGASELIQY